MNWKKSIIITTLIMIPLSVGITWYTDFYRNSTEEFQGLYFSIGASIIGIFLHFFKKHPKIEKKHEINIDAYELLLLMVAPMFVGLNIIKKEIPTEPFALIIPIIATFFIWYIVTVYRTSRPDDIKEGKSTFQTANLFFGMLLVFLLPLIWLILL